MNPTDNITIGLDLGDRRHAVCVLSAGGDIVTEEQIVNTRDCLAAFAARFPAATIVMETGTHSPWVSRLCEARGHRVYVANARKLRAISASHTKSDEEDARMLAHGFSCVRSCWPAFDGAGFAPVRPSGGLTSPGEALIQSAPCRASANSSPRTRPCS